MHDLTTLFDNNQAWARRIQDEQPELLAGLARQQSPTYLWIGCSDSRVPPNQIVGLGPGEIFVHRNVANLVLPDDSNAMAAVHFAVEALRVRHIIVCGHYGCGGVGAGLRGDGHGALGDWLRPIERLRDEHAHCLASLSGDAARAERLCELNVAAQVRNVANTGIVQQAWSEERPVSVHGLIYDLGDGLLRDLQVGLSKPADLAGASTSPQAHTTSGSPAAPRPAGTPRFHLE